MSTTTRDTTGDTTLSSTPSSTLSTTPDVTSGETAATSGLRRVAAISASLVSTFALTSVLGLAFWLLAARQFAIDAVGVGGAAIAMMTLLGTLGTCGLGTLLISRLPRTDQRHRRVLVRTSLTLAGVVSAVLAVVVPVAAYRVAGFANLEPIAGSAPAVLTFAAGTALMSVGLVADQAVLVLGSGRLQTERNALASVVKLAALGAFALAGFTGGMTIFLAWASAPSSRCLSSPGHPRWAGPAEDGPLVDPRRLRGLGRMAASHHALNTTLQAPLQLLPLLVLVVVSSRDNGVFTSALQVTGVIFALPYAITVGLFAAADGDERALVQRMRLTHAGLPRASLLANLLLFPLAPVVLRVAFVRRMRTTASRCCGSSPSPACASSSRTTFVALRRVQNRTTQATLVLLALTVAELAAATSAHALPAPLSG